jgi:hypothetical protein
VTAGKDVVERPARFQTLVVVFPCGDVTHSGGGVAIAVAVRWGNWNWRYSTG